MSIPHHTYPPFLQYTLLRSVPFIPVDMSVFTFMLFVHIRFTISLQQGTACDKKIYMIIVFLRFTCFLAVDIISFFLGLNHFSVHVYHGFFISSFIDRTQGWFHNLWMIDSSSINISGELSLTHWHVVFLINKKELARPCYRIMFSFFITSVLNLIVDTSTEELPKVFVSMWIKSRSFIWFHWSSYLFLCQY